MNNIGLSIKRYQNIIFSFIIFSIILWLVVMYMIPNIGKVQSTLEEQKGQQEMLTGLDKKVSQLQSLDKNQQLDILRKVTIVLPEEKDIFSIFNGLDLLEKSSLVFITHSDIKIGVISTGSAVLKLEDTSKFGYKPIDIGFEVSGSKESLIDFLKNLYTFQARLFTPKNLKITFIDPDHVNAEFILTAYYMPFPVALSNVEDPLPIFSSKQQSILDLIVSNISVVTTIEDTTIRGKSNLFSP